ncbi:response regulator transcription factor [Butyrivibrio sp. WCE2006]|uniref:response regulator transcription factor n=1 Tax=Butyrivibrio sp. WCE2006 TaxID=1410611 RepID=UPI0005D252A2|nr:response regulator [Butyrivibrio sp. WCE2006]
MRVIIVEDEIKIRNGLAKLLSEQKGIEVIGKARNGNEGLSMVEAQKPDLVITDIQMPEMDGLDMLEAIKNEGIKCHSIILTGYAEFDYAKRAISYGADDYLLKPITVDDVNRVISVVNEKIKVEATQMSADPSVYLKAILSGAFELTDENIDKARNVLQVEEGKPLYLVYAGFEDAIDCELIEERFNDSISFVYLDDNKRVFLLYNTIENDDEMKALIQRRTSIVNIECSWIFEKVFSVRELGKVGDKLRKNIIYNMAINGSRIITRDDYEGKDFPVYQYSQETDKKIERILVEGLQEDWNSLCLDMERTISQGKYDPFSVKVAVQSISNNIVQLASKMWPSKMRQLTECDTLSKISKACSVKKIIKAINEQGNLLLARGEERENIRNYTLLKAISYIREHYSERISQEEVASYLSITPEYLSTLFHREMNVNFPSFVNKFRVSHAKRLLRSTDKKIYEVAEEVGFSDTKYFNRVFKDIEGVSPKEFRMT